MCSSEQQQSPNRTALIVFFVIDPVVQLAFTGSTDIGRIIARAGAEVRLDSGHGGFMLYDTHQSGSTPLLAGIFSRVARVPKAWFCLRCSAWFCTAVLSHFRLVLSALPSPPAAAPGA